MEGSSQTKGPSPNEGSAPSNSDAPQDSAAAISRGTDASNRRTLWLYRIAIALGAFLLFLVQPMYAKRLLPSLGGTPAIWNTVMVFFQAALLVGYGYAHLLRQRLPGPTGAIVHVGLLAVALLLPVVVKPDTIPPPGTLPTILWVLAELTIGIGIPFLFVSATSPLLQSWFSQSDHPLRDDPYFLYSASNLGSFAALLAYPLLWERVLTMDQQAMSWRIGLLLLVVLIFLCTRSVRTSRGVETVPTESAGAGLSDAESADASVDRAAQVDRGVPTLRRRIGWVACAAAASSWLLAVTQYITTDLAPVPLLWVVPLSIYLLSFVIVFAQKPIIGLHWWPRLLPISMLVLVTATVFYGTWQLLVVHLFAFVVGVMACHSKIAADRPNSKYLTEFYFWMSAGGVIGGFFNAILAPLLFPVILEYGIAILVAGWFATERVFAPEAPAGSNSETKPEAPVRSSGGRSRRESTPGPSRASAPDDSPASARVNTLIGVPWAWAMLLFAALMFGVMYQLMRFGNDEWTAIGITIAVPLILLAWLLDYPKLSVIISAGVIMATHFQSPVTGVNLYTGRSYFGIHRVNYIPPLNRYRLLHGTTVHGIYDADHPTEPLSYYARSSALGKVFDTLPIERTDRVAAVGLGSGTVSAYREGGRREITVYEIDPMVLEIASNEKYFGYLKANGLDPATVRLGDGRLQLQAAENDRYDMILLDAFSSDAIPMHLMTREAIELYLDRLEDQGLIMFHISNRHLNLGVVLAGVAKEMGLVAFRAFSEPTNEENSRGVSTTDYVLLAKSLDDVESIVSDDVWKRIDTQGGPVWTDDFSNFLDVLSWKWTTRP